MIDNTLFEAIMTVPTKESVLVNETLTILGKYNINFSLETNSKGELWYESNINDIKNSNINENELSTLRKCGWLIENDFLKKYL